MKTSKSNLIAILVIGAVALAAGNASAGGFNFGGGGGGGGNGGGNGGNKGGFKVTFGNNHNNHSNHKFHHNDHHHHHKFHHHHHHVKYYTPRLLYSKCYHPQFQSCYVYPGDTWYSISHRMYGVDFLCRHIASFNGLHLSNRLVVGQQLRIPVVNSNGSLGVSSAPMPAPFAPQGVPFAAQGGPMIGPQTSQFTPQTSMMVAPQGSPNGPAPQGPSAGLTTQGLAPQGLPNGLNVGPSGSQGPSIVPLQNNVTIPNSQPTSSPTTAASIRTVTEERTLPRVAIGSTLDLDGESLGNERGIVRLRVSGIALPVEVIEWSASSVKISLPKLDLNGPVKANLEVLRADGSMASSSAIELTPAATRLALGN
jgi:hypothetical protein